MVGNKTMLSDSQIKILASFFPMLKEKTSKEIEISTSLSHEPTFRILKLLVKNKYLKKKKVGKTNVYEFMFTDDSFFIYTYFVTNRINEFKEKHPLLYKRLKEFTSLIKTDSVILFGSYAKGAERKESDIDLLIVSDKKDIEKIALTFKTKYNILIKHIIVKSEDFKNIRIDNNAFYNDLVMYGIILYGIEFFFKEVYQNAKII